MAQSGRLLILDDEIAVGDIIASIGSGLGYEVRSATTSEEFFRIEADWRPTHVALDLVMPSVDGMQVMAELSRRHSPAAIVIISGAGAGPLQAAEQASNEQGLNVLGAIPKPFRASRLRELLSMSTKPATVRNIAGDAGTAPYQPSGDELRGAIENREFGAVYQPKIRCSDGDVVGVEALARWSHPDRGRVGPGTFIPVAEQTALIRPLTTQLLEEALTWLADLRDAPHLRLSVNFSATSLSDTALADTLVEQVGARNLSPDRLILEFTEASALVDPLASLRLLTRLRIQGFHLAVDDFGVGSSSLAQLARLPFSELKIDTTLVRDASRSEPSRRIVKAITALAHSLDMIVTAEGVEDPETLRYLREIGCDQAQGYVIARPMGGALMAAWIADRGKGTR